MRVPNSLIDGLRSNLLGSLNLFLFLTCCLKYVHTGRGSFVNLISSNLILERFSAYFSRNGDHSKVTLLIKRISLKIRSVIEMMCKGMNSCYSSLMNTCSLNYYLRSQVLKGCNLQVYTKKLTTTRVFYSIFYGKTPQIGGVSQRNAVSLSKLIYKDLQS